MGMAEGILAMTRLYLLRHGATARTGYCNGHLDVDLTPAGVVEMQQIANRLCDAGIAALYASDLKRAAQSAEIIGQAVHLKPVIVPALREKCFGMWEGLTEAELQRRFPREWKEWLENPGVAKPSGGESCQEMAQRVLPEVRAIIKRHEGERIAIVAHGGVNRVILCHALNLDLRHMEHLAQRHGALNIIDFAEDRAVLQLMNG
jgi:broad specificity phosphatase PhoE